MNYRVMIMIVCGLVLVSLPARTQFKSFGENEQSQQILTGNLHNDLSINSNSFDTPDTTLVKRKVIYRKKYSPLRAGLFSAVIPGAGQFYTKSYWQSAAFFSAEVLMWVIYVKHENSGDSKTDDFQRFADEHWSAIRYAHWIQNSAYAAYYTSDILPSGVSDNDSWTLVNWDALNKCEQRIGDLGVTDPVNFPHGTGFTHKLENHGEQQYYEMIGKYAQFGGGWDDATSFTANDILTQNVSPRFKAYSEMRGKANDEYTIARTVSYLIVANHVFSALEAAWNAARINNRIKLQGHIQSRRVYGNIVEYVPTLHFECEL